MKTPMQELIENLDVFLGQGMSYYDWKKLQFNGKTLIQKYLEKEKEVMCEFAKLYDDDLSNGIIRTREDLFNETFNTKER